jgi:predicted Zn-ribbon and HTH transcriptional regulator
MALHVVVGGIGSGKTCFQTWKLWEEGLGGAHVYANYHVAFVDQLGRPSWREIPVHGMGNISDLSTFVGEKNVLGFDEAYMQADSHRAGSMMALMTGQAMLQSRKRKIEGWLSSQRFKNLSPTIREITSRVYEPLIISRVCSACGGIFRSEDFGPKVICPKCDAERTGKPLILKVSWFDCEKPAKINTFFLPMIVPPMLIDIPASYNTYEIVEKMDDGVRDKMWKLVEEYEDWDGTLKGLYGAMALDELSEGLKESQVKQSANYVYDRFIKSKKK